MANSTTLAPTETGADGFSFMANAAGNLILVAEFAAQPTMKIAAASTRFSVSVSSPDQIDITCSDTAETDPISCPVVNAVGSGACSIGAGDTCGGSIAPDCVGPYTAPALGESAGPGTCVAEVIKGVAADTNTVNITEVNQSPYYSSTPPNSATEGVPFSYSPIFGDNDLPNALPTDPGYVECTGITDNACAPWLTFDGCNASGTPSEEDGGTYCWYYIHIQDGYDATAVQPVYFNINEDNQPPAWSTLPSDITIGTSTYYDIVNGSGTDNDAPFTFPAEPGYLTCSLVSDNCSFDIQVNGAGPSSIQCNYIFTTTDTPESCTVNVQVADGDSSSISASFDINTETVIWYVDADASGPIYDGLSWGTAFNDVQQGMDAADYGDMIWAAEGTYLNIPASTVSVLIMKDGVRVYGGFVGTETLLSERGNPADHPTILDGQNTSYHVVVAASSARFDGFRVTRGNAKGTGENLKGGGIYNFEKTHFTLADCDLNSNASSTNGGGIYNINQNTLRDTNTIQNCVFTNNITNFGGGILNNYSSPTIIDCNFTDNTSTGGISGNGSGGAIYNVNYANPEITSCVFNRNKSLSQNGGAIYNNAYSSPAISNCIFTGNYAKVSGGAIINYNYSSPNIINCLFIGNTAESNGGGIYNTTSASPNITNCTFTGNASRYGGAVSNFTSSNPVIKNCILWSDKAASDSEIRSGLPVVSYTDVQGGFTGIGNINYDPLFIRVPVWDRTTAAGTTTTIKVAASSGYNVNDVIEIRNDSVVRTVTSKPDSTTVEFNPALSAASATYWAIGKWSPGTTDLSEDLHLPENSPCVDGGTSSGAPLEDMEGVSRLSGSFPDIGAYEYPNPSLCGIQFYCPVSVTETGNISCSVAYNDSYCTDTLSVGAGNNCTGATVIDNGDGTGSYSAPAQGEAAGPGSCNAEVAMVSDGVTRSRTINITEVNQSPTINVVCGTTPETSPATCTISVSDPDLPANTLTCTLGTSTCTGGVITDCTKVDLPAQGEAKGPGTCTVRVDVSDGTGGNSKTGTLTITEANQSPSWLQLPNDLEVYELTHYQVFNGYATDPDLPNSVSGDPGYIQCSAANNTCAFPINISGNGAGELNCSLDFTTTEDYTDCTVDVVVTDTWASDPKSVSSAIHIVEKFNTSPFWTSTPQDLWLTVNQNYNAVNGIAADNDLPNLVYGDMGYVECSAANNTCSFPISVSGAGSGEAQCTVAFTAASVPETCSVDIVVSDTWALNIKSITKTINIEVYDLTSGWIKTSPSGSVGGIRPIIDSVVNNYPADFGSVTLNFAYGVTACSVSVNCPLFGAVPVTATPSGNDCIVTANSGYWPSRDVCSIDLISTDPACSHPNCDRIDTFKTSWRLSECPALGGDCGGFIDDGTYGTGNEITIQVLKKEDYTAFTPPNGGHLYALLEQNYDPYTGVERQEAFDGNDDGTIVFTASSNTPAKITVGYKGSTGACHKGVYFTERDCFQMTTYVGLDARKVIIPIEYTTTEDQNLARRFVRGDIGIATFRSRVNSDFTGFPFFNPLRIGIVVPLYKNKPASELNLDEIFQPENEGKTITICFGNGGNFELAIPTKIPYNVVIPDIIRMNPRAGCANGYRSTGDTRWRYYTNQKNTSMTFVELGGLANSSFYRTIVPGLQLTAYPIFMKTIGTYSAAIPATYTPDSFQNIGSTPFELDFRDPDFRMNSSTISIRVEGGATSGIGRSTLATLTRDWPDDPERIRLGAGATPPYGDPNRYEQAVWGWGGEDVRYGGVFLALGGKVPGSGATDPGGIAPLQIHNTSKIDDSRFTIFQREHSRGGVMSPPFFSYTNDNPWSGTTTNTGVVSRMLTGLPGTATDPGGQLNWSQIKMSVGATLKRPSVTPENISNFNYPIPMPGMMYSEKVINSITDNSITGISEFLQRPEITNPTHDGYYIPPRSDFTNRPINRNGEIWRGTARVQDTIDEKADQVKYFTLRNPTLSVDATRYPDFFVMYVSDPKKVIDPRSNPEGAAMKNRAWKFYGDLRGKNGAASLEMTIPYILVGNRNIGGVVAEVPKPWQGAGNVLGTAGNRTLEWELADYIIGTNPAESGVTTVFDYQNQSFNWMNTGAKFASSESHEFYWEW